MLPAFARFQPFECDELPVMTLTSWRAYVSRAVISWAAFRAVHQRRASACFDIRQPCLSSSFGFAESRRPSPARSAPVAVASDAFDGLNRPPPNAGEAHSATDATQIKAATRRRFVHPASVSLTDAFTRWPWRAQLRERLA